MKVLVLGALFICWWMNSCAAPKWIGAATGDNYGNDLDFNTDADFLDMELDLIDSEHDYLNDDSDNLMDNDFSDLELGTIDTEQNYDGSTSYNDFTDVYDNKGPHGMKVESMKYKVKPPSLIWIGFTLLRLLIASWYLLMLGSLSTKKNVVSVDPDGEGTERAFVDEDTVVNVRDTVDDFGEVEAVLKDLIQGIVNIVEHREDDLTPLDQGDTYSDLAPNDPENTDLVKDWEEVESVFKDLIQHVANAMGNGTEKIVTDLEESDSEPVPVYEDTTRVHIVTDDKVPNDAENSLGDMDLVQDVKVVLEELLQAVVSTLNKDEEELIPAPEIESAEATSKLDSTEVRETDTSKSTKAPKTDDLLPKPIVTAPTKVRDPIQDLLDEKRNSGETLQQPKNMEQPPFSHKKMLTKKELLVIQNWRWAREPSRPSGHRPKVSFTNEVKVKTFLVKKPMHPYGPEEGPSVMTRVEPLKSEGEFRELGILLTRKLSLKDRVLRGISKLDGAFRRKSAP